VQYNFILIGFIIFALSYQLFAVELYKWTDEYGRVYYTDKPPAKEDAEKLDIKIKSYDGEAQVFDAKGILNPKNNVIMYSAEWCGVCKRAKKYMQENNIAFKEKDIDKSNQAKRKFKKLDGKGVPIILVGEQRMNGFRASKLEMMLKKARGEL